MEGYHFFLQKIFVINNLMGVKQMILEVEPFLLKLLVEPFKMLLHVYHSCKKLKKMSKFFFHRD